LFVPLYDDLFLFIPVYCEIFLFIPLMTIGSYIFLFMPDRREGGASCVDVIQHPFNVFPRRENVLGHHRARCFGSVRHMGMSSSELTGWPSRRFRTPKIRQGSFRELTIADRC
jgi:hypothetical protein